MSDQWTSRKPMNIHGLFQHEMYEPPKTPANRWDAQRRADGSPQTRHGASALHPPMQGTDLRIHDVKEQVAKALPKQKERTIEDAEAVVKAFLSTSPAIEAVAKSNEASKAIRGKLAETSNALLASLGKAK